MNITGLKLHKIPTLPIKRQFAKLWQNAKLVKYNKKKRIRQNEQKIPKQKLPIYWHLEKDKLMHRKEYLEKEQIQSALY